MNKYPRNHLTNRQYNYNNQSIDIKPSSQSINYKSKHKPSVNIFGSIYRVRYIFIVLLILLTIMILSYNLVPSDDKSNRLLRRSKVIDIYIDNNIINNEINRKVDNELNNKISNEFIEEKDNISKDIDIDLSEKADLFKLNEEQSIENNIENEIDKLIDNSIDNLKENNMITEIRNRIDIDKIFDTQIIDNIETDTEVNNQKDSIDIAIDKTTDSVIDNEISSKIDNQLDSAIDNQITIDIDNQLEIPIDSEIDRLIRSQTDAVDNDKNNEVIIKIDPNLSNNDIKQSINHSNKPAANSVDTQIELKDEDIIKKLLDASNQSLDHRQVDKNKHTDELGRFVANGAICDGLTDPFKVIPIDKFIPPIKSSYEDVEEWNDSIKQMKKEISRETIGGEPLRQLIHQQVKQMEKKRRDLFCKYLIQ